MVRQGRQPLTHVTRAAALLLGSVLAAGCTSLSLAPPPQPTRAPAPAPGPPPSDPRSGEAPVPPPSDPRGGGAPVPRPGGNGSAASQSLLTQSRAQRAAGESVQAAASLERALRIDPNNALLWLELGELHLEAGNTAQAASMARRTLTLAGADRSIESRAERLLRAASTSR